MIESMGNTGLQSITDRNCFGRRCTKAKHSTQTTRGLEHPSKITSHPAHTSTESILTPGRVRVDLDGPVPRSLPVKARTGSSREGADFLVPIIIFHSS
ncbi:hypothetical protein FF1_019727 [Malus domestica]